MKLTFGSHFTFCVCAVAVGLVACTSDSTGDADTASGGEGGEGTAIGGSSDEGGHAASVGGHGSGGSLASGGTTMNTGGRGTGGSAGVAGSEGLGSAGASGSGGVAPIVTPPKSYDKPAFTADFENGTAGNKPPPPFFGGKGVVDTTHSFSGKQSIKVTCPSGAGIDACPFSLPVTQYIAANKKTAYARFMVYMDNMPKPPTSEHWDLVKFIGAFNGEGGKSLDEGSFVSFGGFADETHKMHMFGFSKGVISQDCVKRAVMTFKPKEWSCVEFKVDENDILNYGASTNGVEIGALEFPYFSAASACVKGWDLFQGVWYLPTISRMSFGINRVNENKDDPVTVWIDDIAISKSPIGCPAKKP